MYLKCPNGTIVLVDENGFAEFEIQMPLHAIIGNSVEDVEVSMSELAIGSDEMTSISYEVIGHIQDTLIFKVTGIITDLDFPEIDASNLEGSEWTVEICRTGYGFHTVTVTARTAVEAKKIADEQAGDILFSDYSSDYSFEVTEL
jgi:hypothetical protein